MLCEYLSLHVQLCAIYRSHVRRHHPQPQLPTRPPPARILPPERQGQESHPGQSLPLACRLLRGEFDQAADLSLAPQLGPVFGLLFVLQRMAEGLGIAAVLGHSRLAKLGLFLVLARVAHQGSRLSAVRWAEDQAVGEVLGLGKFDEDDLYAALDDLAARQERMEKALYRRYLARRGQPPRLFLYDVTSSYLEGEKNELGEYGYNRDGKRGKLQIVIGLLADEEGEPLA